MSTINFLAKKQAIHESRVEADHKATIGLIILVTITALIWGGAWGTNQYFRNRARAATQQTSTIKDAITANANSEQEYLNFYEKVERLRELLEKREGGTDSIIYTYAYFGQNARHDSAIIDTSYEYATKELAITIGCSNVFCIADMLKLINNDEFRARFPQHLATNLTRTNEGAYQLTLNITLAGGSVEAATSPEEEIDAGSDFAQEYVGDN